MNKISFRFFLTNLFAGLCIIFTASELRDHDRTSSEEQNVLYGIVVLVALAAGLYFSVIKARDLAKNSSGSMTMMKKGLIAVLYVYAALTNIFMLMMGMTFLFGDLGQVPIYVSLLFIALCLGSIVFLIVEGVALGKNQSKAITPAKLKIVEIGLMIYVSVGIALVWNVMIFAKSDLIVWGQQGFWNDLISALLGVIVIVLPFERLFWFEAMSESKGWKDSITILGGILIVTFSSVVPFFY